MFYCLTNASVNQSEAFSKEPREYPRKPKPPLFRKGRRLTLLTQKLWIIHWKDYLERPARYQGSRSSKHSYIAWTHHRIQRPVSIFGHIVTITKEVQQVTTYKIKSNTQPWILRIIDLQRRFPSCQVLFALNIIQVIDVSAIPLINSI